MSNSNMSTCKFSIAYSGDAVEDGTMSVRDLAPALLSISELFDAANSVLNHDSAKVDIHVNATSEGSFEVGLELVQTTLQKVVSLFSGDSVTAALQLHQLIFLTVSGTGGAAGGLFWLIKRLRGRKPDQVNADPETGLLKITIGSETLLEINPRIYELMEDERIRHALRGLVSEPLAKDGIDVFEVRRDGQVDAAIGEDEAAFFDGEYTDEEILVDDVQTAAYSVVSLTFKPGNKWRLHDGTSTISVDMDDPVFLERVANGEEFFAVNDVLICRVRVRQTRGGTTGLRITHSVEQVVEHKSAPRENDLFSPKEEDT